MKGKRLELKSTDRRSVGNHPWMLRSIRIASLSAIVRRLPNPSFFTPSKVP
jgi:hypothetical protein